MVSVSQEIKNQIAEYYIAKAIENAKDKGLLVTDKDYEAVGYRRMYDESQGEIGVWKATDIVADPFLVVKKVKWAPRIGEPYYYIASSLTVDSDRNDSSSWDKERILAGNCFCTRDEAEVALGSIKAALGALHS